MAIGTPQFRIESLGPADLLGGQEAGPDLDIVKLLQIASDAGWLPQRSSADDDDPGENEEGGFDVTTQRDTDRTILHDIMNMTLGGPTAADIRDERTAFLNNSNDSIVGLCRKGAQITIHIDFYVGKTSYPSGRRAPQ